MIHAFSTFAFRDDTLELTRDGRPVRIEPQPARALAALLARAGEVVTRDELRAAIWGDETHVDYDRGIAYCIGQVRAALGDSAETPRFVQTLPRRGFRFIAPVAAACGTAEVAAPEPPGRPGSAGDEPASVSRTATAPAPPAPVTDPAGPAATGASARTPPPASRAGWRLAVAAVLTVAAVAGLWSRVAPPSTPVVAVSIFDNETGDPAHDAFVTGLADVVVTRLTSLAPGRVGVVGNAAALRQPRNIRNLSALAAAVDADYVVLGQLQRQDGRLRFIVHFIRLSDGVHLSAARFVRDVAEVAAFEGDVVAEVERATRQFVLDPS